MIEKTVIRKVLAGVIFLTAGGASAQSSPNIESIGFIGEMINAVIGNDLLTRFQSAGLVASTGLMGMAMALAGALATAYMFWEVVVAMKDEKSPVSAALDVLLFAAVVVFLLGMYAQLVSDIVSFGQYVMNTISPGGIGSAASNMFGSFFGAIGKNAAKAWDEFKNVSWLSLMAGDGVALVVDAIIGAILAFIALLFAIIAMADLVAVAFVGPLALALAIALGPLFIACLASGWTRRWFDQWLNFFVNASLLTAIIALVLTLISTVMIGAFDEKLTLGSSVAGPMLAMALFAMGMGKIFSAIPGFADALMPGRTSAGSAARSGAETRKSLRETAQNMANPIQKVSAAIKASKGQNKVDAGGGIGSKDKREGGNANVKNVPS